MTCCSCAGVDLVGLDGTLYDQMLDWVVYLGLEPARFKVCLTLCNVACGCEEPVADAAPCAGPGGLR